jgi:hypothetical protein
MGYLGTGNVYVHSIRNRIPEDFDNSYRHKMIPTYPTNV